MILGLLRQQRYLCDDSRIREVKAESVRTSAAYVLFYRRVGEAEVAATVAAEEEEGAAGAVIPAAAAAGEADPVGVESKV